MSPRPRTGVSFPLPQTAAGLIYATSATGGLQNRTQDDVNQCYFRFYDNPGKRLGAALAHIAATDPDLVKLLDAWPCLPLRLRNAIAAFAQMVSHPRHTGCA